MGQGGGTIQRLPGRHRMACLHLKIALNAPSSATIYVVNSCVVAFVALAVVPVAIVALRCLALPCLLSRVALCLLLFDARQSVPARCHDDKYLVHITLSGVLVVYLIGAGAGFLSACDLPWSFLWTPRLLRLVNPTAYCLSHLPFRYNTHRFVCFPFSLLERKVVLPPPKYFQTLFFRKNQTTTVEFFVCL